MTASWVLLAPQAGVKHTQVYDHQASSDNSPEPPSSKQQHLDSKNSHSPLLTQKGLGFVQKTNMYTHTPQTLNTLKN